MFDAHHYVLSDCFVAFVVLLSMVEFDVCRRVLSVVQVNAMKSATFNAIFVTIVYWMVGLRSTFTAYLFTWLTTSITSQAGEAISQCISVFTGDAQVAAATVPLVMVLSFLFAGFFISKDALPGFLRWAQKLSFLYWSFQALAKNQYRDFQFPKSFRLANELNSYSRWYVCP